MKIPKVFMPEIGLEEKTESLLGKNTVSKFKNLIYDSLQVIRNMDGEKASEDFSYSASFQFNEGTNIIFGYKNKPFFEREKGLTNIDGYFFGLDYISIKSTVKDPIAAIEQTFSTNPFEYKSLPFQETSFALNKTIRKDDPLLKIERQHGPLTLGGSLIVDRMVCNYHKKEDCYELTIGDFYRIVKSQDIRKPKNFSEKLKRALGVKEETFHTMSIYEVLPFTEREKYLLSNMEYFEIGYRFPRPYEDADRESKCIFKFMIKKTGDKHELDFDMSDGFTSGLDLKSIWPAEQLFDYLNSKRKMVRFDEKINKLKHSYRNIDVKTLHEKHSDPLTLYKDDAESFIAYFSSKETEEKKKLIEHMINCDFTNEKVITWLDKNESELVRDVGLKQI